MNSNKFKINLDLTWQALQAAPTLGAAHQVHEMNDTWMFCAFLSYSSNNLIVAPLALDNTWLIHAGARAFCSHSNLWCYLLLLNIHIHSFSGSFTL